MSFDKFKQTLYDLQQQVRGLPVHRYGVITALDPLTLVLDGERGKIFEPYKNCPVNVGDRVSCLRQGTQTIILAVVGGGITAVMGGVTLLPRSPVSVSLLPATVVFDRPFKTAPNVQVTMTWASGSSQLYVPRAYSITGAGFTVGIYTGNGSNATVSQSVNWLAVGELA